MSKVDSSPIAFQVAQPAQSGQSRVASAFWAAHERVGKSAFYPAVALVLTRLHVAPINGQHFGLFPQLARWVRSSRVLKERLQNGQSTGFGGRPLPGLAGFVLIRGFCDTNSPKSMAG